MKKAVFFLAAAVAAVLAVAAMAAGIPQWVDNSCATGAHKFYTTDPGDQGTVTAVQVTAGAADISISFHNYTSDLAWQRMRLAAAYGDTNLTVYSGETILFTFDRAFAPDAFFTSGGTSRVWAE